MSKLCLVTYASKGREDYCKGQLRLIRSALNFDMDIMAFRENNYLDEYLGVQLINDFPICEKFTCHRHSEIPYQFKFGAIQAAREKGYERIFWLDSSMQVVKDLDKLLDGNYFVCFDNLGHPLYKYITDDAVQNLGIVEEELKNIPQVFGGALGFDFTNPITCQIFDEIVHQSMIGSFKDGWSNREGFVASRHDQAVISVVAWKHGITPLPYGTIVCPPHDKTGEYGTDFYITCRAID